MTKRLILVPILSLVVILAAVSFLAPVFRRNNPDVPANVTAVLLQQGQTNFDAPALEVVSLPFYRVVDFSGTTGKVAVYHRFGFRIATITIQNCETFVGVFRCGGDTIDYGLGW